LCIKLVSIKELYYDARPTKSQDDAEESCFKRNIKIYIKNAPTCFGLITIIRERAIWALLKLLLLKKSVKIHHCGQFGGVAAYIIRSCLVYVCDTVWDKSYWLLNWPQRCILTDDSDCFSNSNFSKAQIVRSLIMVIKPKHVGSFLM